MQSCIYEGEVCHQRFAPVTNRFKMRLYMMMLDLDELNRVFKGRWLWSTRGFSLAWFRPQDHFINVRKHDGENLRWLATKVLAEHGINEPIGTIRLLTQLRYIGFAMNPVSFFYCYQADGKSLRAIIAEVNNTPWGEQHLYVIDAEGQQHCKSVSIRQLHKAFHVSPFMPMDMKYSMRYTRPKESLAVRIENFQHETRKLDVVMLLKRREITARSLALVLVRYPLISLQVFAGIYWQAMILYRKNCPFFPHPKSLDNSGEQADTCGAASLHFKNLDKKTTVPRMHPEEHRVAASEMKTSPMVGP